MDWREKEKKTATALNVMYEIALCILNTTEPKKKYNQEKKFINEVEAEKTLTRNKYTRFCAY